MKQLLIVPVLGLLTACGGGTPTAAPTVEPTYSVAPVPKVSPCPVVTGTGFRRPAAVPADLPVPPSGTLGGVTTTPQGLTIVRFSTPTSLQQSVLFVVREVQKAGYTLGRGDAEPAEADAPFGKGDLRGLYKMFVKDTCVTDWQLAVTKVHLNGTSPLLPMKTPGPSSKPLPFG